MIQCLDCLTVEVVPDFLGNPEEMRFDPLLDRVVVNHRGPLNREQLRRRPPNAPRVREIRDEPIECDICRGHGGDCWACEGKGVLQREMHQLKPIMVVAPDDWLDSGKRQQILREMWGDHVGYPDEFYAAKDTFREDAVRCYWRHRNPGSETGPHACGDYKDKSKQLTDDDWRARGAAMGVPREDVFLCAFCPYQSVVTTRMRAQRGDYD